MANIITDVSGIKNVRMTNARFARQPLPAVFTSWTTIRVALFVQMNDSGANITGTPRLAFGLCSGNTNIMGDATTTHFVGMQTNLATWPRAITPVRYSSLANAYFPCKKVGTTNTFGTTFTNTSGVSLHTTAPSFLFLDITVGSPNYSMRLFSYLGSTTPVPTEADFLTQSVTNVPAFTNHVYNAAQTVAVNEGTDGTLDHACVWWNQGGVSFDILNWRVYKLA